MEPDDTLKAPTAWTDEERQKVARAVVEHRLSRVDLYMWREADREHRSVHALALEFFATHGEIERRIEEARERLRSTLSRPSQEAYLGKWVTP